MGLGTFVHLWILYGSILQNLPKRLCDVGTWWRLKWSNYSLIWDDLTMIWGYPPHSREPPFEWKNTHDECVFPYMWIKILQYIVWSEHNLYIQLYPGNYHNSLTWNQKNSYGGDSSIFTFRQKTNPDDFQNRREVTGKSRRWHRGNPGSKHKPNVSTVEVKQHPISAPFSEGTLWTMLNKTLNSALQMAHRRKNLP